MFKKDSEVDIDTLHLYSLTYRYRVSFKEEWKTCINIILIESIVNCKLKCKERDNKKYIKNTLLFLKVKKYILSDITEETNYTDMITIEYPKIHKDIGYCTIDYLIFDAFPNTTVGYLYSYIHCFSWRGRAASDSLLSKLTGHSKSTVRRVIEDMQKDVPYKIYKESGVYDYDSKMNLYNKYYTNIDGIKNKGKSDTTTVGSKDEKVPPSPPVDDKKNITNNNKTFPPDSPFG